MNLNIIFKISNLIGSPAQYSLNNRIFNALTLFTFIGGLANAVSEFFLGFRTSFYLFSFAMSLIFLTLYFFGKRSKIKPVLYWLFLLGGITIIVFDWKYMGGLQGISSLYILSFSLVIPFLFKRNIKYFAFLLMFEIGIFYHIEILLL